MLVISTLAYSEDGATKEKPTFGKILQHTENIFVGKLICSTEGMEEYFRGVFITYKDFTFEVEQVIKGDVGKIHTIRQSKKDALPLNISDRAIIFTMKQNAFGFSETPAHPYAFLTIGSNEELSNQSGKIIQMPGGTPSANKAEHETSQTLATYIQFLTDEHGLKPRLYTNKDIERYMPSLAGLHQRSGLILTAKFAEQSVTKVELTLNREGMNFQVGFQQAIIKPAHIFKGTLDEKKPVSVLDSNGRLKKALKNPFRLYFLIERESHLDGNKENLFLNRSYPIYQGKHSGNKPLVVVEKNLYISLETIKSYLNSPE